MNTIDKQLERVSMEASLVADAQRYRWLKQQKNVRFELSGIGKPVISVSAHRGSLDSSVDAYMTKAPA